MAGDQAERHSDVPSIVGSYSSTKWLWINWMVRHDLPTPPPPTTTSLYSRRNCGDGERQQSADSAGRAATKKRPSESLTLDAMVSGRRLRNEETKWEGQKKNEGCAPTAGSEQCGRRGAFTSSTREQSKSRRRQEGVARRPAKGMRRQEVDDKRRRQWGALDVGSLGCGRVVGRSSDRSVSRSGGQNNGRGGEIGTGPGGGASGQWDATAEN